jgi:ketosteroid isomerase-like protein
MRKLGLGLLLIILTGFVAGCGGAVAPAPLPVVNLPTKAPPTLTPVPASDKEGVVQLIRAEGEAVVQQDIDRLLDIWATDGQVVDANHTPDNAADDAKWIGWDAIRQRYVNLVFPSAPMKAEAGDLQVALTGDQATITSTTNIGDEVSPSGDRWTLEKRTGRWYITGLTYNLEPKTQ